MSMAKETRFIVGNILIKETITNVRSAIESILAPNSLVLFVFLAILAKS